ncbi:hypothetical protein OCAE111667_08535 [Occultella aeris]|uniref:Uncharacterized protein n=1 Tax=Occultella aeris TaxID=2761496 RepID=A0A7M4DK68_9MICO|nr:hypothetical protein [Occultella aeris]VZO37459.1 hypothetical protein HALOF300_02531 [Occultella aeris]
MDDPHIMGEGCAPTPFTADEIRMGCPDGHTLRVRTTAGDAVREAVHRFEDGDAGGVTLSQEVDGEVSSRRVRWVDLQTHASFPAERTTIEPERITTPLGELDCLRYSVRREGLMTFWFATAHPGMPVRYVGGGSVTEVVSIGRA